MNLQQLTKSFFSLLLMLCLATFTFAQEGYRAISGTVRDAAGNAIEGVTVSVKGRSGSVMTNAKGNYTIPAETGQTLTFTHIAFTTKEMKIGENASVNISLDKSNSSLEDVVVVGYGTQKKAHLTGSVVTIKSDEIQDLPVSNLGAALAGRVVGLSVSGGTARPGSNANLVLRNPRTYAKDGGTQMPLFVIDGVIQVDGSGLPSSTQFNMLDASEIESLSFLKDGAAAIYGSRAANGVVIVTTKRGKSGTPRVSYSGQYSTLDETYRPKLLNAYEYGMYYNIMNGKYGAEKQLAPNDPKLYFFAPDELAWMKTVDYNWLDPEWSAASNMRHTLNISGGNDRANYFASASYYTQDGNIGTLDYKRWTFRAGADMNVAAGLKVGLQVAGNFSDRVKTFNKVGGEQEENDYKNLLLTPRWIPIYYNGLPVKPSGPTGNSVGMFHYDEIQRLGNLAETKSKTLNVNLSAEYELPWVKNLKFRLSYARYFTNDNGTQIGTKFNLYEFNRTGTYLHKYDSATVRATQVASNGNRILHDNTNGENEQVNFTVNYNKQVGAHSFAVLGSVEKGEAWTNLAQIYRDDPLQSTNGQLGTAFGPIDGKTEGKESGTLGYIGRLNYNYSGKYLFEFLFRTDASTHFAPENYWGNFYSASAGWVISSEKFFNSNTVNFLKLRASYGKLGRDDTKPWMWRQRYTYQNGKGLVLGGNSNATTGMKMEASPSRDATWSDDFKHNLGIDATFLKNRLSATVEGFYNKNRRMLMEKTAGVPVTGGGTLASTNSGAIDGYGYEVSLGWNDKIGKDVTYGIDLRLSWMDVKWVKGNFNVLDAQKPWVTYNGRSEDVGAWGYDLIGMFKSQADIDNYVKTYNVTSVFGSTIDKLRPGMLYYKDIRGQLQADGSFTGPDGIIDDNDVVKLANRQDNHYNVGMTLRAGYKGLSFEAVISGSFGGWAEIDGGAREKMETEIDRNIQNRPAFWNNIWDPELNPNGYYPNPAFSDMSLKPRSTFWQVGSFRMGIRNASLAYSLPKKWANAAHISNARFLLTAVNLVNFYNPYSYKGPDGAYDAYPALRTISLGVNLTL